MFNAPLSNSPQDSNPTPDNDWLLNDPLGFDDVEYEDDIADNFYTDTDMTQQQNNPFEEAMTAPMDHSSNMVPDYQEQDPSLMGVAAAADAQPSDEPEIEFDGDTSRANPHFKPLLPAPIHRGESGRQLIMDTETTGLDALKGDRIVEVGIVELVDRKFTGEKLHVYINPQRGMDEEVIRVHGISEAFLADKPTFDKVAQKLYDFMLGAEVIAHNATFDISFLSMEFDKVGLTDFADQIKVTDSLAMAKQQYPGQKNTLDALVRRLNVGKMDRTFHGALLDSEILAEVYLAMTGGQVSLAIDEDTQTEGENSHADFSHLAAQILKAPSHFSEHLSWVAKQIKSNAVLAQTQGVTCFQKIDGTDEPQSIFSKSPVAKTTATNNALNLINSLFIAS